MMDGMGLRYFSILWRYLPRTPLFRWVEEDSPNQFLEDCS